MDESRPEQDHSTTSDQSTLAAMQNLTASIQSLVRLLHQESERRECQVKSKNVKDSDPVLKALSEEIAAGRPTHIPKENPVELMSQEEIDEKNDSYREKYTAFWKDLPSPPADIETTDNAYQWAFDLYSQIYHSLGWHKNEDILFTADILSKHRDDLLEALFAVEAYRRKQFDCPLEPSRAAFEYSRLPRLLLILARLEARRNDGLECRNGACVDCRYFGADQTLQVLIEVGRTVHHDKYWSANDTTLQELLHSCYARRILSQPNADKPDVLRYQFHLIYDCLGALDFTSRFLEVRDALCLTFYTRYQREPIHKIFDMEKCHRSSMKGIEDFKELPLEEFPGPTFSPDTLTVQYLQDFGGLRIEWTDNLDDHLKIFTGRNALRIFAHPTFFYNCRDLVRRDYIEPLHIELSRTYALLFRPSSRPALRLLQEATKSNEITWLGRKIDPSSHRSGMEQGTSKSFDVDLAKPSTTRILENFHRCSLPPSIQAAYNVANPFASIKDTSFFNQHKFTTSSMRQIHALAPYYPEDIMFMIMSIFQNGFHSNEAFIDYEYFGPRLRRLKTYLDNQQPTTLKQLWFDRRDARAWWTFWGGAFFLIVFVVLAALNVRLLASK
ncbi:hypothetical protein AtubIFM56815_002798 [Aspergillus tubingensis]|uniref:Uncharacterized protein n=2 Tax=Aspergillus subgen. Circumdati TaxID=2720871 RepID=A0A8H3XWS6_ASPTU|nr:fungal specific transcription factor domain family protein [Aspergillus tubingensis]GAQ35546.1 similar to An03g00520 [Aspergillus niger]GFN13987.1 fungal specific transcription factor domain family protein [Aspergillus tubingensis]GLA65778.1 hypothetical protein AtubIFM54640_007973 [Aspergillus tubingensis]GLA88348.1 hypothetical protein AtubIFM56815_002798 [Aspergillus tubingensis]GLA94510.1 hypothetical protein AtubIFM57143_001497 [Aspergillus tubingensis]